VVASGTIVIEYLGKWETTTTTTDIIPRRLRFADAALKIMIPKECLIFCKQKRKSKNGQMFTK
jgi:hypothetical protein